MAHVHDKSGTTVLLDTVRRVLLLASTGYAVYRMWNWNWIVSIIAAIPILLVSCLLANILTAPLYLLAPEERLLARWQRAIRQGDMETAETLDSEFTKRFNAREE